MIERQIDFGEDTLRYHSIKSRWYSNKKVVELKSEYEKENNFKYDFVMIYRFDCMFNKDVVFSEFDNKYFYNSHVDECHKGHCHCKGMGMYADLWFFGNTDDINLFGELYDSWDKYEIEKSVLDVAKSLGIDHEYVLNKLKHLADYSEDDNIILQSAKELGKIVGTSGTTVKHREVGLLGVFQGFWPISVALSYRSEERRVGIECRSRWSPHH